MWKKYKKEDRKRRSGSSPQRIPTVSVTPNGLRFNISAIESYLKDASHVELLYDENEVRFGIRPLVLPLKDSFELKKYSSKGKVYTARVYCSDFIRKVNLLGNIVQTRIFTLKLDAEEDVLIVEFNGSYKRNHDIDK